MSAVPTATYNGCEVQARQVAALTKAHEGKPLAALQGDAQPILDRLEQGESAVEIAASLGINRVSLYAWLIRHCPEQWQAIATARQLSRLDECEDTLDSPLSVSIKTDSEGNQVEIIDPRVDNAIVTRARDKARMAQWHLERANRKLFGDTKQIDINQSVTQELRIISDPGGALARRLQSEAESVVIDAVIEDPPDTVSD